MMEIRVLLLLESRSNKKEFVETMESMGTLLSNDSTKMIIKPGTKLIIPKIGQTITNITDPD